MDLVVYLALAVLAAVFIVSLIILLIMCRRRGFVFDANNQYFRFSKMSSDNIEGLSALSPLMAQVLDKNSWVYDVTGLLHHSVSLLRLCHTLTEKLNSLPLEQAGPQINKIFFEATQKVMPRFDDLLEAVASPHVDVRILEARATALVTVCWALFIPTTFFSAKYQEMLGDPLQDMEVHLSILRDAAAIAARTEIGKLDVDWKGMEGDGDDKDKEKGEEEEEKTEDTAEGETDSAPEESKHDSAEDESVPLVDVSHSSNSDSKNDE